MLEPAGEDGGGKAMNNDDKLKLALAKMLPEQIEASERTLTRGAFNFRWKIDSQEVYETEWLQVCNWVEQMLNPPEHIHFRRLLVYNMDPEIEDLDRQQTSAPWKPRATALAKVKGIEV